MKRFGLFANLTKPQAIVWAEKTVEMLKSIKAECCAEPSVATHFSEGTRDYVQQLPLEQFENFADVIISFGGDGTMLAATRAFLQSDIPIMGVNLGKLGFLAEFSAEELGNAISAVMTGEYLVENRTIIEASVNGTQAYALNDFVLQKSDIGHMISVRAHIDGETVAEYRADALIVATPSGSTAYSLSSGGPVIAPSCPALCLTPVSPHSLTLRPLVVPDTSEVSLEIVSEQDVLLLADGQAVSSGSGLQRIDIRRSEQGIKLLKRGNRTYFDLLRTKLLWAADASGNSD